LTLQSNYFQINSFPGIIQLYCAWFPTTAGRDRFRAWRAPDAEDAGFFIYSGDTSPCIHGVVIEI
jgi:hypothetical protein